MGKIISTAHWLVVMYSSTLVLLMAVATPDVRMTSDDLSGQVENDPGSSKRGWNDVQGSWGKRGWNDLESVWGKRAWERLNGAWGKRLTLNPQESFEADFFNEISKRPEWSKLKGSWGKRVPEGAERAGWSNLKGLWGKRAWDKLGNSWGKRTNEGDFVKIPQKIDEPFETLHSLRVTTN